MDGNGIEKDDTLRFEDKIKLHHLKELMRRFARHEPTDDMPPDGFVTPGRIIKRESGNVTVKEFKEMIQSLFKTTAWDNQMENLFAKVDTSADGMVDWNEFCTYMLLHYRENDNIKRELPLTYEPNIRHITQNRQEIIQCVIALCNPPRYVTLSKEGILCCLDAHFLHIEKSYEIKNEKEDLRASKRRCKTWYTDITYMGNTNKLVISSTGRDLRFWDVSCPTFFEEFHLYALPDVPVCLDYWYDKKNPTKESLLIAGDDHGSIHLYHFTKPLERLFETPFTDKEGVKKIWAQNLHHHQRYVRHTLISRVHSEMIRKVVYIPENDSIMSSSGSSKTSLVLMDTQGKKKSYTFKINKGVECFDFNKTLNIIATGSINHHVYLWNPFVQERATACLMGHMMTVVGVAINEVTTQLYSYAKDGVIKVWDLKEYSCLQTFQVRFPCLQHLRSPEYGTSCLLLHQQSLIACCGDHIGTLKLGRTEFANHKMALTHKTQLCCAIYNSFFKQVATGADDSTITVWDLTSGSKSFSILEAHNTEEITCMVFNTTGRKLITGARNGTIKVWNFQNGHNINQFEPVAEAETTGLVSLGKKKGMLAVGWSRKIAFYNDRDSDTLLVKGDTSWKGGQVHKDDILAVDYCPPNLLATASFDGEIIVWSVETETIFVRLRKGQSSQVSKRLKEALSSLESTTDKLMNEREEVSSPHCSSSRGSSHSAKPSRPNSRHRAKHKQPQGFEQAPVDKIVFLKSRIINKGLTEGAVLISSEAGWLNFWSIYGFSQNLKGYFYGSSSITQEESVLAMATNQDDSSLITGDTMGHVYVWNIADYCLLPTAQQETSRPALVHTWRAHDLALVSIEYIPQEYGSFVLTASTDQTARLWTSDGHYVGTFGQSKKWNLRNPETYAHPKSPWSHLEEATETQQEVGNLEDEMAEETVQDEVFLEEFDQELNNNVTTSVGSRNKNYSEEDAAITPELQTAQPRVEIIEDEDSESTKKELSLPSILTSSKEAVADYRPKPSVSITQGQFTSSQSPSRSESNSPPIKPLQIRDESSYGLTVDAIKPMRRRSVSTWEDEVSLRSQRSMTMSSFGSYSGRSRKQSSSAPSLLGRQVDQDFARITLSRQERRHRYGEVDMKATQRFGKLCSPFQALTTLKTDEVLFPTSLPMTPRMLTRGLTCTNESELRSMSISPTPGDLCRGGFVDQATSISPLPAIRRSSKSSVSR
ncbi:cilia- and flagella-associated protein 337-like isoform X1 [Asterias amurensis]|uniref:cilia- and flagella-associated protein 337-like isoform X1 n=1 Tax=Asterias amurensis TaxID=7602 RepID=UPI003AB6572A